MENVKDLETLLIEESEKESKQQQEQEYLPRDAKAEQGIKNAKALCSAMYTVLFKAIAKKRGDLWDLDEDEALELGESTCEVILKYFPDFYLSPELRLGAALVGSVGFRVVMDIEQQKDKEAPEDTESNGD